MIKEAFCSQITRAHSRNYEIAQTEESNQKHRRVATINEKKTGREEDKTADNKSKQTRMRAVGPHSEEG